MKTTVWAVIDKRNGYEIDLKPTAETPASYQGTDSIKRYGELYDIKQVERDVVLL